MLLLLLLLLLLMLMGTRRWRRLAALTVPTRPAGRRGGQGHLVRRRRRRLLRLLRLLLGRRGRRLSSGAGRWRLLLVLLALRRPREAGRTARAPFGHVELLERRRDHLELLTRSSWEPQHDLLRVVGRHRHRVGGLNVGGGHLRSTRTRGHQG